MIDRPNCHSCGCIGVQSATIIDLECECPSCATCISSCVIELDQLQQALDKVAHPLPAHPLLNVNIPSLPYEQLQQWEVTRLGKRHPYQPVIRQTNPRGEPIYWIGPSGEALDATEGTDFHAIANGRVSITPLQLDPTHTQMMAATREWARRDS